MMTSILTSNDSHIDRAFEMVQRRGRRKVALFGLAFKPGTDDLRESPFVSLAERLIGKGFDVAIFDRSVDLARTEEHTSELQSLMRSSYAVFCLKKKKQQCIDR